MSAAVTQTAGGRDGAARLAVSPAWSRAVLVSVIALAVAVSFVATAGPASSAATLAAGDDLTRLLRAMAVLKAAMAGAAAAGVVWRLGSPVAPLWLLSYAAGCAAMAAGPGLIWRMTSVGSGALLLHGGLLAICMLLWRDPVVGGRLAALVSARRAALRLR